MRGPPFPSHRVRLLVVSISLALAPLSAACVQSPQDDQGPVGVDDPGVDADILRFYQGLALDPELRLETDHGTIHMLLYRSLLPTTSEHIGRLAAEGFYDDTLVHRVVDDFVIQGGDPSGTGLLGSGETVPFERDPHLRFAEGAVGLARDLDPDSGDSQWFITEKPAPHLDDPRGATGDVFGAYTLFGQVFAGMDVVRAIAAEPVVPGADRPIEDVVVETATLLAPPQEVDLLDLVRTLDEDADGGASLSRPLHLFAGHEAAIRTFQTDEAAAWTDVTISYEHDGRSLVSAALTPLADDPQVWTGTVRVPDDTIAATLDGDAGPLLVQQVVRSGDARVLDVQVPIHRWSSELTTFGAPGAARS